MRTAKFVLYTLIMLMVVSGEAFASIVPEPQRKTTSAPRKKSAPAKKKKSAGKKAKSAKGTKSKKGKRAPGPFEGSLLYRSTEWHSWQTRKLSAGNVYNGDRTTKITIKGKDVHIEDQSMHLHTIWNETKQVGYLYSDVTREGVKMTKDQFMQLFAGLQQEQSVDRLEVRSDISISPETESYKGDQCRRISGRVSQYLDGNLVGERDVEVLYSNRHTVSKSFSLLLYGFETKGVVKKGILSFRNKVPLLGQMKSQIAIELVGAAPHKVTASELTPPSDIQLTTISDVGKISGLYKRNSKELKKRKIYPETKSSKETKRDIREPWAFADEWLSRKVAASDNDLTAWKLGQQILDGIGSIAATFSKNGGAASSSGSTPGSRSESMNGDNGDMLYIPDLTQRLRSEIGEMQSELAENDRTIQSNKTRKRTKLTRVGGKYIEITDAERSNFSPTMRKENVRAMKSVIKEWEARLAFVENYAASNHTDYIPKDVYHNMIHKQEEQHQKDFKREKEARRAGRLPISRYGYSLGESTLQRMQQNGDYTIDEVRKVQKDMEKIRKKNPEIHKSVWEDWDGFHDPY